MAEIVLGYFLEDIAHAWFLQTLIERIATEQNIPRIALRHELRNVTGGAGTALSELRAFVRDVQRSQAYTFDVLIVAIDSNCHRYVERRNQIQHVIEQSRYPGSVVFAIPDPHIERWYLEDARALQQVLQSDVLPQVPAYKCERDLYKQALRQALKEAGVIALLGGAEYGDDIANAIDLYKLSRSQSKAQSGPQSAFMPLDCGPAGAICDLLKLGKADTAFKHFVDSLREALRPFKSSPKI